MTINQLQIELANVARRCHPLTETGVDRIELDPVTGLVFDDVTASDLRRKITSLNDQIEESVKAEEKALKEADMADREKEEALRLLDEVKDDAGTLRQYRDRCEAAEEHSRKWRIHAQESERETTALRKRKGFVSRMAAHEHEILNFLAQHSSTNSVAKTILEKIRTDVL